MRSFLLAFMLSCLGADATFAQVKPGLPPASPSTLTALQLLPRNEVAVGISPHRQPLQQPGQKEHGRAVADCMGMWDAGTHMSKQVWARTCTRVQTRLDNLKIDGLMPMPTGRVR
jgi:hypothetical protein